VHIARSDGTADVTETRAGELLAQRAEALAHRATAAALAPDDYDSDPDLAAVAGRGLAAMRATRWTLLVPQRFHRAGVADFEDADAADFYQPTLAAAVRAWAAAPKGRNLVLLGSVGTGKTHAAVAAARLRHDAGDDVRFLPVVEMLDLLRPGGPERALYDLADVGCLVLDDLGSERPTDWTAERLYALVNRRWMEERSTVATSNLPATRAVADEGYGGATLDETLGPRLFSRLVGSGAVIHRLTGPDRRRARRSTSRQETR
jgi:DNA replication protein DnaC